MKEVITDLFPLLGTDEKVRITMSRYSNGVPALVGTVENGEPYGVFTVNLVDYVQLLKPNQTFIKNYSEGEGNLEILQRLGVIGRVLFEVKVNHVTIPAVQVFLEENK